MDRREHWMRGGFPERASQLGRRDVRVGDAERDEVTAALHEHFAQGRLTRDELDERLTATLSAKTVGDLRDVTRDLPDQPSTPSAPYGRRQRPYGPVTYWRPGAAHRGRRHPPRPWPGMLFVALIVFAVATGWWFVLPLAWLTFACFGFWYVRHRRLGL